MGVLYVVFYLVFVIPPLLLLRGRLAATQTAAGDSGPGPSSRCRLSARLAFVILQPGRQDG